jgi:hypothetical protein
VQLTGFLKGVHLSRITGSQIHPVRNAPKSRAGCGNDAPRAEKRDTDLQGPGVALGAWKPAQNAGSHISTATAAAADQFAKTTKPAKIARAYRFLCRTQIRCLANCRRNPSEHGGHFPDAHCGVRPTLTSRIWFEPSPTSVERYSQTSQVKNSPLKFGFSKRSTVSRATSYVPRPPPPPATRECRRGSNCWVRGQSGMRSPGIVKSHVSRCEIRHDNTIRKEALFVNERQQKRHFGIAARALTNTLQSGSSQTNKSLDGLPRYSTAGRNSTFFAAIVTCVLFSIGRG